ncbi:hypothetical protein EOL94_02215 [bacterium]|nr:hypothetical protein [bacterium]
MKIILASKEKFLIDKGYDLLGISKKDLKVGIINTATQVIDDQKYLNYIEEYCSLMEDSKIDFKLFDIKGKTEKEIMNFFSGRNVIQIFGGNAFYLLKIIKETKFDLILNKLLEKGLSYVGCSAGSYIMCPTIEVASWKSDRNRHGLIDFSALNYVPFLIKCHFTDEKKDQIIEKAKDLKYLLRILRDDQCFVLKDNKIEFFGLSKEVIL